MKVMVAEEISAPGQKVWELVRGFGEIMKWSGPPIQSVSVEGDGIGAVRTIALAGGAELKERLEAYDDEKRSFSYSFVGKVLLPLDDYYATLTVVDAGDDRCRVEWGSTFEPNGVSDEQAAGMVEGIYRGGIAGIRKALSV